MGLQMCTHTYPEKSCEVGPSDNKHTHTTMTQETKNKWSVIINIALTSLTALLSALGFSI